MRDLLDDPEDLAILEGVMRLATAFRCQVIAEGAVTLAQGVMLLQLGCELAQGYAIARPMPAAAIPGWLAGWRSDPGWLGRSAVARDDLPLLYAGVAHRAWVGACVAFLNGAGPVPPLEPNACQFGAWLASAGLTAGRTPPGIADITALHQAGHAVAAELLALHDQGRNPEALARLGELHALRDRLLAGLAGLLTERPGADQELVAGQ
ncbi:MAG: EAL domain-containing protein [Gammaproteobacteria bacterium]|nr:EAL domain-containing protein [Gammaproteobacteria bacterium]